MILLLNDIEIRIFGCLVEKSITTPDYYPMTLNALRNACNQKSNRNPLVSFDETTVVRGLESLQEKGLTEKLYKSDSRVPKYQHHVADRLHLKASEVAVLCELMLRGPQTTGEIRGRADRMYKFKDLQEVDSILNGLMEGDDPFIIKLPRQAGRKERRYMHLFAGTPEIADADESTMTDEPAVLQVKLENERISSLEEQVASLHKEVEELKKSFFDLKSQFD